MGVLTPRKQSPLSLGMTWSGLTGMITKPALAREVHSERMAAATVMGFILIFWGEDRIGLDYRAQQGGVGLNLDGREWNRYSDQLLRAKKKGFPSLGLCVECSGDQAIKRSNHFTKDGRMNKEEYNSGRAITI